MHSRQIAILTLLLSLSAYTGCEEQESEPTVKTTAQPPAKVDTFDGVIKVGDAVPDLEIPKLLQSAGTDSITLGEMKGSTVVLEFWATWCVPCHYAIPHMNELVDTFADDENIRFISITDESEQKVQKFLNERQMKPWIGLDQTAELHKAFSITGIPHVVIIAPDGKVVTSMHPMELNADTIRAIHQGG